MTKAPLSEKSIQIADHERGQRRFKIDDGRKVILVGKKLSKVIPLMWFERLGRAVLDGATPEEIEALRQDHFSNLKGKA